MLMEPLDGPAGEPANDPNYDQLMQFWHQSLVPQNKAGALAQAGTQLAGTDGAAAANPTADLLGGLSAVGGAPGKAMGMASGIMKLAGGSM